MSDFNPRVAELIADKKKRQQDSIPSEWLASNLPTDTAVDVTSFPAQSGKLSARDLEITETSVDVLLAKLANVEWSSVEVTTAFYKRAIIAHQLTNCLTEIFVEKALARAAEVDAHLKNTGNVIGPLHGLPVSLKDQICLEGLETTMGYVSWLGDYAKKNAVVVDLLLQSGAVPFVRTNIPQTLMWPETFNNIFGRTTNPYNRTLTSGGSSGGEGALIAMKGSPLGVGSDVGGSVRVPAALCGLYGMRPCYGRIPYAGTVNSLEGLDTVVSVLGPLSNSLGGVKAFLKAIINQKPWTRDSQALHQPWSEEAYQLSEHGGGKLLCFAIMWDDGVTKPHPPITRALETAKKALLAAGHNVIDWNPIKHKELYDTMGGIWGAGAAEDYAETTKSTGEPIVSSMVPGQENAQVLATGFRPSETGISAYQLFQLQRKKRELRQEYLDHWLSTADSTGTGRSVDAILSPAAPHAAPPHGLYKNVDYTMVFNVLDYPTAVVPVSVVDPSIDVKEARDEFYNDEDKVVWELYDPAVFKNAPVAIQVTGKKGEDEATLAISEIVDAALKAHKE